MIPELGHFALILALGVALLQTLLPLAGWRRRDARLLGVAGSAAQAQFFCIAVAYACLTYCFVTKDFSLLYVAENDHTQLPLFYRVTAVWGAHEGSLLLWVLILSGWTLAVSIFNRRLPADLSALVLSVLGSVSIGFLLFILLTSNPFTRLFPVPAEGHDLNPILQDPGLAIHPPMLYMGYVGFSVAFAFAIAALISGRLDAAWARWTRPWTTTAWLFLTMGITLGSWWAYNELGWGGWWFWDPVENASFMPWLAGTALIHSLAVTEKRGLLKSWTVLLAILAFSLSLLGTFLVRSGVLVSVHAFASDPARGMFILIFMAVVVGGALTLYAIRAPKLVSGDSAAIKLFSREGLLLLNNVFLVVAAAAILLGTLYPLVLDALHLGKISVGPPYFNAVFVPLIAPLFVLVGIGAVVPWKRGDARSTWQRLKWPALAALLIAVAVPFALYGRATVVALAGGLLAAWTVIAASQDVWRRVRSKSSLLDGLASVPRAVWGMTLAHIGLGVWALGVAYVGSFGAEKDIRLQRNAEATVGGYNFRFNGADEQNGPNYKAQRGSISAGRGADIALSPEKRFYPSQGTMLTESAVDAGLLRDLYVSLGEGFDDGSWSLRIYVKPMVRMIWFGGVLMFLGGLLAASDKRYRLVRAAERKAVAGATAVA